MSLITRGSVLFVAFPPQPAQLYSYYHREGSHMCEAVSSDVGI